MNKRIEKRKNRGERIMKRADDKFALLAHDDAKVQEHYRMQVKNDDFNFYEEKNYVENLLNTRLNYLLTIISIFILAAVNAPAQKLFIIVLWLGFVFCLLVGLSMHRQYCRLNICLSIIYRLGEHHVLSVTQRELNKEGPFRRGFTVVGIAGIWIPLVSTLVFLAGAILASIGTLAI